ncbi:MAG: hypothetical protein WA384_08725 [Rhodomicrobium sp.]
MKQLALHIVDRMQGRFDPSQIEDRYKKALDALIAAKAPAGAVQARRKATPKAQVIDLMDALRASAGEKGGTGRKRRR